MYILITLTKNERTSTSDDMSNDRASKDGQRLFELKQTGTAREYISDFGAIVLELGWNNAALEFRFYRTL
jgi:hypothetical protein